MLNTIISFCAYCESLLLFHTFDPIRDFQSSHEINLYFTCLSNSFLTLANKIVL